MARKHSVEVGWIEKNGRRNAPTKWGWRIATRDSNHGYHITPTMYSEAPPANWIQAIEADPSVMSATLFKSGKISATWQRALWIAPEMSEYGLTEREYSQEFDEDMDESPRAYGPAIGFDGVLPWGTLS